MLLSTLTGELSLGIKWWSTKKSTIAQYAENKRSQNAYPWIGHQLQNFASQSSGVISEEKMENLEESEGVDERRKQSLSDSWSHVHHSNGDTRSPVQAQTGQILA